MINIFMSEIDGGAFVVAADGDIATESGVQSLTYSLLFNGATPLDYLDGESEEDFEDTFNEKISSGSLTNIKRVGEAKLQLLIKEKIVKSLSMNVVNTALERIEVSVDFILIDGTGYSTDILIIENGQIKGYK